MASDGTYKVCTNCIVFLVALLKLELVVAFDDCKNFFILSVGELTLDPFNDVKLLGRERGLSASDGSFFLSFNSNFWS